MGEAKRKKLPSLREWLAENVPASPLEAQREPFEEARDFAGALLDLAADPAMNRQFMSCRMMQAAMLALVETSCEAHRQGFEHGDVLAAQANALGQAFGYLIMSLDWKADAPIRSLAIPFAADFKEGMKRAIDRTMEDADPSLDRRHGAGQNGGT